MSFYGNTKRINSSPFIFDKIYSNRLDMENNCGADKVYIGRYILIKYTTKDEYTQIDSSNYKKGYCYYKDNNENYILENSDEAVNGVIYYTKNQVDSNKYSNIRYIKTIVEKEEYTPGVYYTKDDQDIYNIANGEYSSNIDYYRAEKDLSETYMANLNKDLNNYGESYDSTVWQKIYTNTDDHKEKYIMIAELNAAVPHLILDIINPKYIDGNNKEHWYKPEIKDSSSSEDAYTLKMPNILELGIGTLEDDFYGKDLINPSERKVLKDKDNNIISQEDALTSTYNYLIWKNYLDGKEAKPGEDINEKKLEMKFYAFGQMISNLYDVLYGIPNTPNGTGARPFFKNTIENLIPKNGLIGILSSIGTDAKGNPTEDSWGRPYNPGMYYNFNTVWRGADYDNNQFLENIPKVIGSGDDYNNGRCHFKIKDDWTLIEKT